MKRVLVLLAILVGSVGCQQPHAAPEGPPPAPPVAPSPPPSADIDFAKWPTATKYPVKVAPAAIVFCAPKPTVDESWVGGGGEKRHGPHFNHHIVVRVTPTAIDDFKAADKPLPVGTTVVKEKHNDALAEGAPAEYGAMIKREPGYDPQHGDWEYLYVVQKPEKKVTRGKLQNCIDCHSHVKDGDYLFRTYIPGKAKAVSDW